MGILKHLSQTIDDFRTFSEPDREKIPFRINQVLEKTLKFVGELFTHQGISIKSDFVQDSQVTGFPNEFSQALLNLLLNARDALVESRTGNKWIKVSSRPENGRAVVTITDNGGGVDENIIDKIFDPYFTTKKLGKGSGIELFMSKNIIERNRGGHLSVRNIKKCAEFRIEV
nr:HAMP domain-containing sensor histidine kinase [Geobacter grbiciae]